MNNLESNQPACINPSRMMERGGTCLACYWSHVRDGQWCGSDRCFNSGCVKLADERRS